MLIKSYKILDEYKKVNNILRCELENIIKREKIANKPDTTNGGGSGQQHGGEGVVDTCRRELVEETGLYIPAEVLPHTWFPHGGCNYVVWLLQADEILKPVHLGVEGSDNPEVEELACCEVVTEMCTGWVRRTVVPGHEVDKDVHKAVAMAVERLEGAKATNRLEDLFRHLPHDKRRELLGRDVPRTDGVRAEMARQRCNFVARDAHILPAYKVHLQYEEPGDDRPALMAKVDEAWGEAGWTDVEVLVTRLLDKLRKTDFLSRVQNDGGYQWRETERAIGMLLELVRVVDYWLGQIPTLFSSASRPG
jgi:hypothetical protein